MEENIIKLIAEAERKAAAQKAQAQADAARIITDAEKSAVEIAKTSEETCKAYREKMQRAARMYAQGRYERKLEKTREEAKNYAEERLSRAEPFVNEILERLKK